MDEELARQTFSHLKNTLDSIEKSKGAEKEKMLSKFKEEYGLIAEMVKSYSQAYASWKEMLSEVGDFAKAMLLIGKKRSFINNIASASMIMLYFPRTTISTTGAVARPFLSFIERKRIEKYIQEEIKFLARMSARAHAVDVSKTLPKIEVARGSEFNANALRELFATRIELTRLLNLPPSARANYVFGALLSTVDPAKLTESQRILYNALSKIDFSIHRMHKIEKIIGDTFVKIKTLGNREKVYDELLTFVKNLRKEYELFANYAFEMMHLINKTPDAIKLLTAEARIEYLKATKDALIRRRVGGLPLGDHWGHQMINAFQNMGAVISFIEDEMKVLAKVR
jgi:hypothetical protein